MAKIAMIGSVPPARKDAWKTGMESHLFFGAPSRKTHWFHFLEKSVGWYMGVRHCPWAWTCNLTIFFPSFSRHLPSVYGSRVDNRWFFAAIVFVEDTSPGPSGHCCEPYWIEKTTLPTFTATFQPPFHAFPFPFLEAPQVDNFLVIRLTLGNPEGSPVKCISMSSRSTKEIWKSRRNHCDLILLWFRITRYWIYS